MLSFHFKFVNEADLLANLESRYSGIRQRLNDAARRAERSPDDIKLVAVTKTHSAETIRGAVNLGMTDFGENRVQEAESKIESVGRRAATWHLIGHLQANKARRAVKLFDVIHSLDSTALAVRLDRHCEEEGRTELPVLIQVDLGGEVTKTGISTDAVGALADVVVVSRHLRLIGLMTLPPFFENPEQARPCFARLRELRDQMKQNDYFGSERGELSMGMTHDFEVAIEEQATIVRIGTAIFGERANTNQP